MIRALARILGYAPSRRALDAAGGGRRWKDDRPVRDAAQVTHAGAAIVAARAQSYAINNPHGARIVETLACNLAGTGIVPRPMHSDEQMRARLVREFAAWTDTSDAEGLTDFYGLQANVVRDLAISGEHLSIWTSDPGTGAPQLRRLHPEQLDRSKTTQLRNGGTIVQGVERSADGRITAYWIRPRAPGDALAGLPLASERHPASEIIHVFRPLFPGQARGLSWFAPVLLSAYELGQLTDAMLVRSKVAALFAGVITDPDGEAVLDGEQSGSELDVSLEPGAMVKLPPGKSIDFSEPPSAGDMPAFMIEMLRTIAVGAGLTYEQLSGDYSRVNYSSARAALLEFRRFAESVQYHTLVFQFCRPVWDHFIHWLVLRGIVPALAYQRDRAAFHAVKWLPPAWPWVDPLKDAQAAILQMRNNVASRSEIVAERGYDVEQLDREIAADRARERALGIEAEASPISPTQIINGGQEE